jgi:VIT1/CCC1 family predicted Fe2+/Mn2+ transporter
MHHLLYIQVERGIDKHFAHVSRNYKGEHRDRREAVLNAEPSVVSPQHPERHFHASELIRDIVIGMADGLTVPFALAAGLSGTLSTTLLIVTAGFAEIAAGAIAMGLGGYLAVRTDHEYFESEFEREHREVREIPEQERAEVAHILSGWGLKPKDVEAAVNDICEDPERWVHFMMKYELGLEKPRPGRARNSSLTIAFSYITGGLVPLTPYMLIQNPMTALWISIWVTLAALFVFGYVKGKFTGTRPFKSALSTMLVGGIAAGVAYLAAKLIA